MTIMTYIIYALIRKRNDIYNICSKSLSFSGRERWEFGPSLEGKSEVRSLEGRGEVGCGVKKEIWVRTSAGDWGGWVNSGNNRTFRCSLVTYLPLK